MASALFGELRREFLLLLLEMVEFHFDQFVIFQRVIQGGDEKLKNEVQIKDLILGGGLTAIKDRDEYLKKQAEAQFAVPVDNLVEAVNRVLTRHGIAWT